MDIISYALAKGKLTQTVSDYLDEHLTNPTNPPIDDSLTIEGAAADAKETGTRFTQLFADITAKVSTVNGTSPDENGNVEIEAGGISGEAVALLITILTSGVYTSDQSANIEALLIALGGLPVTWEKVGRVLVFSNVDAITSVTQDGTTLICA